MKMDVLESKIKDEIGKLYKNATDNDLTVAVENLTDFYKLVIKIMQENQAQNIPENSSKMIK